MTTPPLEPMDFSKPPVREEFSNQEEFDERLAAWQVARGKATTAAIHKLRSGEASPDKIAAPDDPASVAARNTPGLTREAAQAMIDAYGF